MNILKIIKPDDWHVHFRDERALTRTVNDHAKRFARALVMPNLKPPLTTVTQVTAYQQRISAIIDQADGFKPYFTLYLTETTTAETIRAAKQHNEILACKLYPAGVTTGSEFGVQSIDTLMPVLAAMEENDLVLCIHGEVNDPQVDVFDREAQFIDKILNQLCNKFPKLRIVLEHITTREAVDFVASQSSKIGATITPHHLALNRNDLLGNGIRPHLFCLPILKRERHQQALLQAATSGDSHFFLGTDSAPHALSAKLSDCGCAGIYTGYHAIEIYAEIFEQAAALDKLENFASCFGATFYGLPTNQRKITLRQESWQVPESLDFADEVVVPLFAGQTLRWQCQS